MKPCRRCGGDKAPGWRGIYCPVCTPVMQAEARERKNAQARKKYAEDGASDRERNQRVRVSVPNDALREAFLRSGMTKAEAAHALGWYGGTHPTGTPKVDTARFSRTIGLNGHAYRSVHRSTALRVGAVLGLDPVDLDV